MSQVLMPQTTRLHDRCYARPDRTSSATARADAVLIRVSRPHAGFNVILVSRTESKLKAVATDLEARYGVQTKVVPADFVAMEEVTWDAIAAVLSSVPLGVLINSAGKLARCSLGSICRLHEHRECNPTVCLLPLVLPPWQVLHFGPCPFQ